MILKDKKIIVNTGFLSIFGLAALLMSPTIVMQITRQMKQSYPIAIRLHPTLQVSHMSKMHFKSCLSWTNL